MRRHDLTKKYLPTYIPTHLPTYLPTYVPPLENTLKERSERLVTYETFDQSDEKTWPDQEIPTYLHTYPPTYLPTYVPPLENTLKERSKRLVTFETFDQSDEKTWPDQKIPTYLHTYPLTYLPTYLCTSIREQPIGAIIGTCDIWDTDYNTDNWEPGFMTIFVTSQLWVTLDSICNCCDVFRYLWFPFLFVFIPLVFLVDICRFLCCILQS